MAWCAQTAQKGLFSFCISLPVVGFRPSVCSWDIFKYLDVWLYFDSGRMCLKNEREGRTFICDRAETMKGTLPYLSVGGTACHCGGIIQKSYIRRARPVSPRRLEGGTSGKEPGGSESWLRQRGAGQTWRLLEKPRFSPVTARRSHTQTRPFYSRGNSTWMQAEMQLKVNSLCNRDAD